MKVASITKNLDFATDKDKPVSLIHCRSCLVSDSMISKLSPAIPPSSTNSSIRILVKSPSALAVIPANVDGALPCRNKYMGDLLVLFHRRKTCLQS